MNHKVQEIVHRLNGGNYSWIVHELYWHSMLFVRFMTLCTVSNQIPWTVHFESMKYKWDIDILFINSSWTIHERESSWTVQEMESNCWVHDFMNFSSITVHKLFIYSPWSTNETLKFCLKKFLNNSWKRMFMNCPRNGKKLI